MRTPTVPNRSQPERNCSLSNKTLASELYRALQPCGSTSRPRGIVRLNHGPGGMEIGLTITTTPVSSDLNEITSIYPALELCFPYQKYTMSGEVEIVFLRRVSLSSGRNSSFISKAAGPSSPSRLAFVSHGKLDQEASSPAPNLRRCVGHHSVFCKSIDAIQEERRRIMDSLLREADEANNKTETKAESDLPPLREHISKTVKAIIRRRSFSRSPSHLADDNENQTELVQVPSKESKKDDSGTNIVTPPSDKRKPVTSRRRKYASIFFTGRKVFAPVLQACVVGYRALPN